MARSFPLGVLAVALALFSAHAPGADPITVKIADHFPAGHIIPATLTKPWMERVEALTAGKVKFQHFPAEQLVKQKEALPALQRRIVNIGLVNPGLFPTEFELTGVAFLPGGYASVEHGGKAITKLLGHAAVRDEFEKAGITPLLVEPLDAYEVMTRDRAVAMPADVKGLRIRAAGDGQVAAARALGATSVTIGAPEIYTAIQRGTLDGSFFPFSVAKSYRLAEVAKHSTRGANVTYAHVIYCVSTEFWNGLDPAYRTAMQQAAGEVLGQAWKALDAATLDSMETFRGQGMSIVDIGADPAANAAWQQALGSVREEWAAQLEAKGKPGKQVLEAWLQALDATR